MAILHHHRLLRPLPAGRTQLPRAAWRGGRKELPTRLCRQWALCRRSTRPPSPHRHRCRAWAWEWVMIRLSLPHSSRCRRATRPSRDFANRILLSVVEARVAAGAPHRTASLGVSRVEEAAGTRTGIVITTLWGASVVWWAPEWDWVRWGPEAPTAATTTAKTLRITLSAFLAADGIRPTVEEAAAAGALAAAAVAAAVQHQRTSSLPLAATPMASPPPPPPPPPAPFSAPARFAAYSSRERSAAAARWGRRLRAAIFSIPRRRRPSTLALGAAQHLTHFKAPRLLQ